MFPDPYFMFMAEAEGDTSLVTTDEAKFNRVVRQSKEYLRSHSTIPASLIERYAAEANLNTDSSFWRRIDNALN